MARILVVDDESVVRDLVRAVLAGEGHDVVEARDGLEALEVVEGSGLPEEISRQADRQVSIPMRGPVESLNVGVAAALVLYEAFRQRNS